MNQMTSTAAVSAVQCFRGLGLVLNRRSIGLVDQSVGIMSAGWTSVGHVSGLVTGIASSLVFVGSCWSSLLFNEVGDCHRGDFLDQVFYVRISWWWTIETLSWSWTVPKGFLAAVPFVVASNATEVAGD